MRVRFDRKVLNEILLYLRKGNTAITYINDRIILSSIDSVNLVYKQNEIGAHF
jgi:hypothetical protein